MTTTIDRPALKFPPLIWKHDAWGTNRFVISTGPGAPPVAHINYTVERVEGLYRHSQSAGVAGPLNAEAWTKLLAAAPDMVALLRENVDALITSGEWTERARALLHRINA